MNARGGVRDKAHLFHRLGVDQNSDDLHELGQEANVGFQEYPVDQLVEQRVVGPLRQEELPEVHGIVREHVVHQVGTAEDEIAQRVSVEKGLAQQNWSTIEKQKGSAHQLSRILMLGSASAVSKISNMPYLASALSMVRGEGKECQRDLELPEGSGAR